MSHIREAICQCMAERKYGRMASAQILANGNLRITTRISRDPSRSSNGGEYNMFLIIYPDGRIRHGSSCDFWQPDDKPWLPKGSGRHTYSAALEACVEAGVMGRR